MATILWSYFRDQPPTILVGSLEFAFGSFVFVAMFHLAIKLVGNVKFRGNSNSTTNNNLSYSDTVSLCCKMISALFAITSCTTGTSSK
jgi:hypothetical protein